ncbi:MAG TPA: hypothetical protein VKW04_02645 [Planctomycetota bacterium]|nr:hypothetical protein [Planctomycetota bacterium]
MQRDPDPDFDRPAVELSLREWLLVALVVSLVLVAAMRFPFRGSSPEVERDYRIPYALSTRYELYRRYTTLAAAQFPTLIVGDSVVWGQCARKNDTLSHHLNELVKQPRFGNAGLDGMHPVALAELLTYHAPAIANTRVILQFDALWLMLEGPSSVHNRAILYNRPDLIPRLAAHFTGPFREAASLSWSHLTRNSPLRDAGERLADARLDFLAWSLDHPYESPLRAISSALPPSEDSHPQRLVAWSRGAVVHTRWGELSQDDQWLAFLRIISLLQARGNDVLVLLGPMNEHMMGADTLDVYLKIKADIAATLLSKGIRCFVPSLLPSEHYGDICHPLGAGYADLAQELLQKESAWLLGLEARR